MTSQHIGADFTGGTRLPNYVNGRLLTAEDLATGQATLGARDRRLGRAAGHGVVDGLWVKSTTITLIVAPGLGVARSGDVVAVGASVTLPLVFTPASTVTSPNGSFSACTPTSASGGSAITAGCYLLTASPACQLSGQAPTASPPGSTTPVGCVAQWKVEGVQFKVIELPLEDEVLDIPVTDDNRRNLLAHWCLGSRKLAKLGADPIGFTAGYSGFDTLDPADLTEADLPLAVFYWNGQVIDFVDNWSARRRITAPDPIIAPLSGVVADRRAADGQARLLQFQDQAAELIVSGAAGSIAAKERFPLLPPVGFLPVGVQHVDTVVTRLRAVGDKIRQAEKSRNVPGEAPGEASPLFAADHHGVLRSLAGLSKEHLDAAGAAMAAKSPQPGFDPNKFFGTAATCGGILDWEIVDFALRQSWENTPVAVTPPPTEQAQAQAPLLLYLVLQNIFAEPGGGDDTAPNLYFVFIKKYRWVRGAQPPFVTLPSPFQFPGPFPLPFPG